MAATSPISPREGEALLDSADVQQGKIAAAYAVSTATDFATGKRDAKQEIHQSKERCQQYFEAFKNEEPKGQVKMVLATCLSYVARPLLWIMIFYFKIMKIVYKVYLFLPLNVLNVVFGVGLCFFGGTYFATIAAIEGFRQFGGQALFDELKICWEEGERAGLAVEADSKIDANKDDIPDVQQMDFNQWSTHTAAVCMIAVKDPTRLQKAVQFLMTTWLAVLAVLKFQFAKTISLCLAVAEMLEMPASRFVGPVLAMALGPDLNHWCFAIISTTIKVIAVVIATWVQSFISAFYSGLRGGKMFAEGVINIMAQQGWLDKCPVAKDADGKFDPNASFVDECIAYPLAAAGIYWQVSNGFALPFPFDLILFPLLIVEWFLKWQIFAS